MFPYCRLCQRFFDTNGVLLEHYRNRHKDAAVQK